MFRPIRALTRLSVLIVCGFLLSLGLTVGGSALASTTVPGSRLAVHDETPTPGATEAGTTPGTTSSSATACQAGASVAPGITATTTEATATVAEGTSTPATGAEATATPATTDITPSTTETPATTDATPSTTETPAAEATTTTTTETPTAGAASSEPGVAPLPTPIATEAATPDAAATPATSTTQIYTGDGYSISYPQGWNVQRNKEQAVFTNSTNTVGLAVAANSNPYGAASAQTALDKEVAQVQASLTNVQDCNLDATIEYAGATWHQKAFEGDTKWGRMTYEVLTTNHPANSASSKMYEIVYFAPGDQYTQDKTTYIKPMLDSFMFTV